MSPQRIRLFLCSTVCAIALYFSARLVSHSYQYFSLNREAKAQVDRWEILPIQDRFALRGSYTFLDQEKTWQGASTLSPPYYLNEFAALSSLQKKAKQNWTVYYNSQNPSHSALERLFPINLLFRVIICYIILIYFFYLYKKISVV